MSIVFFVLVSLFPGLVNLVDEEKLKVIFRPILEDPRYLGIAFKIKGNVAKYPQDLNILMPIVIEDTQRQLALV